MNWLLGGLIGCSVLLVVMILLQRTNIDGAGMGFADAFGTRGSKRGLEKTIFKFTIFLAVVFVLLNLLAIFVK